MREGGHPRADGRQGRDADVEQTELRDVDLFVGSAMSAFLGSNARGGNFEDKSALLPASLGAVRPLLGDFDYDGQMDILVRSEADDLGDAGDLADLERVAEQDPGGSNAPPDDQPPPHY